QRFLQSFPTRRSSDLVLIQSNFAFGQATSVRGVITDLITGETLPYVTVTVPGTTIGTSADDDGRYAIKLSGGQTKLRFNFIGYLDRKSTRLNSSHVKI